jgi:hypothetical protein
MSVDVACQCGARFRARDHLAGKKVPCPRCAKPLAIPAITAETLAPLESSSFGEQAFLGSALPALSNPAPWAASEPDSGAAAETATRKLGWDLSPKQSTSRLALHTALLLGTCVLMIGLCGICLFSINRGLESTTWPETRGQIVSSKVIGIGRISRGRRYNAQISYVYSVNGHDYQGSRVSMSLHHRDGRLIGRKYRTGSTHPVYYDPDNPNVAVLEHGIPVSGWIFPVVCVISLIGSLVGAAFCGISLLHRLS